MIVDMIDNNILNENIMWYNIVIDFQKEHLARRYINTRPSWKESSKGGKNHE